MKKLLVLILIVCCSVAALAQNTGETKVIDTITIENFDDDATEWVIRGSKDVDAQLLGSRIVEAWPMQLFGYAPVETRLAYGIRAGFERRGNNYIEIIPPGGVMQLPGVVQEIEMWVWNTNREYYLTAEVQDIRGVYHTIDMGSIDHLGWEKVSAKVPGTIRQLKKVHQGLEGLRLIKFIVWTDPSERVDDFQLYFDEIRVLSDVHRSQFDGVELADPEFIRNTWNGGNDAAL